jgi:hypothetical protein
MKLAMFCALGMLAAVNASEACAWTYIVIDRQGNETISTRTPRDLTYPPENVRIPALDVAAGTPPIGTPLSAQRERQRMNADMLIITDYVPVAATAFGVSAR